MGKDNATLSKRACITAEPVRINRFVLQEEAVARDDQCAKALEEVLAQRESTLSEEPITRCVKNQ